MKKEYEIVVSNIKDPSEAPKDKNLFYRCLYCSGIIPSIPKGNVGCECGNIFIDIDYWRLVIRDYSLFEVVKKKQAKK